MSLHNDPDTVLNSLRDEERIARRATLGAEPATLTAGGWVPTPTLAEARNDEQGC